MTDEAQRIIDDTFDVLVKTYAPQPVVMDRGQGCRAWDTDGKEYLDFAAGIAVASLGHAHPALLETINTQAARLMACQASYATKEKLQAAKILVEHSCFDLVYFSNSGTEGIETAIKMARKWAYDHKGHDCHEIIAFHNSFHGRSMGAASLTEKCHSQPYFGPYLPGVHFATFNDIDSVRALVSDKTAAIFIEPVQGEGGLAVADQAFMNDLRALCDERRIALVFDEIQCGMGRLGTFFAYENWGVEPDIVCLAKGIGSGFPVGAVVAKGEFGAVLVPGTHGTTYGGNPLACAVAATVMKELLAPGFLENVRATSALFFEGLEDLKRKTNKITAIKGMGLMVGLDTGVEIKALLRGLQDNGLMATQAGKATLRLTPPLIAGKAEIEDALEIIGKTLAETE
ncbi:MAG: acetylornithine/succinylornithine family transaminase [Alphaproteobacteria bacterium]|nr:acetylornithine/succinylornithine family transaminase [Alphaproteobacteria bacterium]